MTGTVGGLELLTGEGAGDLLRAAVATAGGRLGAWRVTHVDHRPGEITTVAYRARVDRPTGSRDEVLGASVAGAGDDAGMDGVLTLSDGENVVTVWCLPVDPDLPALSQALDEGAVADLLTGSTSLTGGEPVRGSAGHGVRTRLVTYRPRRRAVVRVDSAAGRFYVKVLRPGEAEELHRRHRLLHGAGVPVPPSLGWSEHGLLLLEGLPGTGLRDLLLAGSEGRGEPDADEVLRVLNRLPEAVRDLPRREPWSARARGYARVVGAAMPSEGDRAAQLADAVLIGLDGAGPGTDPTHGDFYEAQLMVGGSRICGVLDVDTAGPGRRADDLACALAHAEALGVSRPDVAGRAWALAAGWEDGFREVVDPRELHLRTAGVLLSLATGPHRVQREGWQDVTTGLLDRAESHLR